MFIPPNYLSRVVDKDWRRPGTLFRWGRAIVVVGAVEAGGDLDAFTVCVSFASKWIPIGGGARGFDRAHVVTHAPFFAREVRVAKDHFAARRSSGTGKSLPRVFD